ncbi:NAD(P)/FAD-dependent oxidoreductase [Candidatus Peregrinibacteria bacterium]|nr:NAD(P)/FAD-dependent oxidoreductase [Candidatus Peregrinibacteria bacterium]
MSRKIAVIAGAGPAGLTAAYELLARTDVTPIVCEETSTIGGIAQTYNYKGNRIDIGGHRFFSKSDRVMNWWFNILPQQGAPAADTAEKEGSYATEVIIKYLCPECVHTLPHSARSEVTGGESEAGAAKGAETVKRPAPDPEREDSVMLQRPRLSRIFYRKHFFPYPIGITLTVARHLGFWNMVLIGLSYIKAQAFPLKDEAYLDAFFVNRFGRRLYKTFFEKYTEKVWGIPCSQIRADWGAQRIRGLSLKRAVSHAIKDLLSSDFAKAQQERETSLITRFFYPKFGPGQMWETVARQIQSCGGDIRMKARVSGVHLSASADPELTVGNVASVTVENVETGTREEIFCDVFISTMPIKHLIGMMTPRAPTSVVEVAEGLQYRDFLTVGLLLKNLHVLEHGKPPQDRVPDNWIYIQDGDVRVGRVQIFNNWSPYMVADWRNTVWIGLEYFVNEGGDLWIRPDRDLIALGIREMEQIGFLKKDDVLDACVLRMPKAYPAYWGSYGQLRVVRDYVEKIPNIYLVGRNGMHRYNNQDHSMLASMIAVDSIAAGLTDRSNLWNVNLNMDYHE